MNAKQYLNQYGDIVKKIQRYRDRIASVENTLKGFDLDGMPRNPNVGDPTKNAALNLAILGEQLKLAKLEAEILKQEITGNIERMRTPKYKQLLYDRYIKFMTWEEIAQDMDYFRHGKEYEVKSVAGYMRHQAEREFEEVMK